MGTGYSGYQAYIQGLFAQRNQLLVAIASLLTQISSVESSLQPTYTLTGPDGSQTVDKAGMLSALNASLAAKQALQKETNDLINQIPYQFTSCGR